MLRRRGYDIYTSDNIGGLKRWSRLALAELWDCSDRKIDRMREDGRLGEPIGYVGRSPIWSDEQRLAAERAGLAGHQVEAEAP
jgi:hypothetical protein